MWRGRTGSPPPRAELGPSTAIVLCTRGRTVPLRCSPEKVLSEYSPLPLRRQLRTVQTWWPLLVGSIALAAAGAFVVSTLQPKVYQAESTLIVGQSLSGTSPDYTALLVSQRLSTTYATVATTRPLLENVIKQFGLNETPEDLAKRVSAEAPLDSTLLTIRAQDGDPIRAAALANALASQLIAASPAVQGREAELQASIEADLKATQKQLVTIQAEVERLTALANPSPAQLASLDTLQARVVSLRSTYATMLGFANSNSSNLLSVVQPAAAARQPDLAAPPPEHDAGGHRGAARRGRDRRGRPHDERHGARPRRHRRRGRPADPGHDRPRRVRPERQPRADRADPTALADDRGLPIAPDEPRVRLARVAAPDAARDQLRSRGRQDGHRGQPGDRLRPGRLAGPADRRRPAQAECPHPVRRVQSARTDHAPGRRHPAPRWRDPAHRPGAPADHDQRSGADQPGRDRRVAADARDRRPSWPSSTTW